jgi:hypothetical protein
MKDVDIKDLDIEEIGNNLFFINGERIYAPNIQTAVKRYLKNHKEKRNG